MKTAIERLKALLNILEQEPQLTDQSTFDQKVQGAIKYCPRVNDWLNTMPSERKKFEARIDLDFFHRIRTANRNREIKFENLSHQRDMLLKAVAKGDEQQEARWRHVIADREQTIETEYQKECHEAEGSALMLANKLVSDFDSMLTQHQHGIDSKESIRLNKMTEKDHLIEQNRLLKELLNKK